MKREQVFEQRTYRSYSSTPGLVSFTVTVQETDLFISASHNLREVALDAVLQARFMLEAYIEKHPEFKTSLVPLPSDAHAPPLIRHMLDAGKACTVGPMAAVAGAVAEYVGRILLQHAPEVIVENGGDVFIKTDRQLTVGVFAGRSPLSERLALKFAPSAEPFGICTSSGTVGPSLSFGAADAVTVKSRGAALADAAATAVGNLVAKAAHIEPAIEAAKKISGLDGVLIIKDDILGVWGDFELTEI